ncbi:glycerophosphodiester phosphodiesterase family protein [Spirosoma telluris]|uniref:glycerophosphodiester phosphodiesterase family protein n=1 Tax=Spirosoma telluris TaxID=2183553 RepID=UPI002FC2C326
MRRIHYLLLGLLLILFHGCRKTYEAVVPYDFTNTPGSGQFVPSIRKALEGVYTISNGASQFGDQAVLKWTYLLNGADTTHYLSIFMGTDATYFNLEASPEADSLVLKGYWRKLVNESIGEVRFIIREKHNGKLQLFKGELTSGDTLVVDGLFGEKTTEPNRQITLTYNRPLNPKPFAIMAHRSGGRTSDLLPASENSVEIIKLASRLGATGIEVDVRFTKDGVPVLYHDNTLNLRLIQKNGLTGPLKITPTSS